MANTYELLMKIGGRLDSSYTNAVSKSSKNLSSLEKSVSSIKGKIIGAVAAYASLSSIKSFASDTVSAAKDQIDAETKLQAVLQNVKSIQAQGSDAYKDSASALEAMASKLQGVGVIGDEVTLSGMQQLATFQLSDKEIGTLSEGMTDLLAQQKGLNATQSDAVTIGNMIGKAMNGSTSALSRVGISFTDAEAKIISTGNSMQRAQTIAQVLKENVGGVNKALASTDQGKIQQVTNAYGDMKEEVGKAILPLEAKAAGLLNGYIPTIQKYAVAAVNGVSNIIQKYGPKIISAISSTVKFAGKIIKTVSPFIKPIIADVKEIATNLFPSLGGSAGDLQGKVISLVKGGLSILKSMLDWIAKHGVLVKGALSTVVGGFLLFKSVRGVAGTILKVSDGFKKIKKTAKLAKSGFETAKIAGMLFSDDVKGGFAAVASKGLYLKDKLKAVGSGALGLAKSAGKLTLSLGKTALGFAKTGAQAAISAAKFVIHKGVTLASAAASKIAAAGQWLLNAAMSANPIGIIITLVAALVAAVVLLYNNCKSFRDFVNGMFSSIASGFKSFVNLIISGLNVLIGGLNKLSFDVPSWVPLIGGKKFGFTIPEIPKLANGGIVKHQSGGILANIGEGKYDEAVVPLKNGASTGGSASPTYEITYSPQIMIQGNASKADVTSALDESQTKFNAWIKQWIAEQKRRSPGGQVVF
jgi:phage-related protein